MKIKFLAFSGLLFFTQNLYGSGGVVAPEVLRDCKEQSSLYRLEQIFSSNAEKFHSARAVSFLQMFFDDRIMGHFWKDISRRRSTSVTFSGAYAELIDLFGGRYEGEIQECIFPCCYFSRANGKGLRRHFIMDVIARLDKIIEEQIITKKSLDLTIISHGAWRLMTESIVALHVLNRCAQLEPAISKKITFIFVDRGYEDIDLYGHSSAVDSLFSACEKSETKKDLMPSIFTIGEEKTEVLAAGKLIVVHLKSLWPTFGAFYDFIFNQIGIPENTIFKTFLFNDPEKYALGVAASSFPRADLLFALDGVGVTFNSEQEYKSDMRLLVSQCLQPDAYFFDTHEEFMYPQLRWGRKKVVNIRGSVVGGDIISCCVIPADGDEIPMSLLELYKPVQEVDDDSQECLLAQ